MNKQLIKDNAKLLTQHLESKGYRISQIHPYNDTSGNPIYWRLRLKHKDTDEKMIRPMSIKDGQFVLEEPVFTGKKPIYKLNQIKGANLIFWVEGEAVADALSKLGLVATTSGSATSQSSADLEPLSGKAVRIWPDNDIAGQSHASAVADLLKEINCSVATIDVSQLDLPKGGDFVDWQTINPEASKEQVISIPLVTDDILPDEVDEMEHSAAPYPIDALPDSIRNAVVEVADFTKAPIAMIASSALAAISVALQSQADVARDRNLTGPSSLFFLVIADSGERKSTVDKYFTKAIRQYELEQIEFSKPIIKEYESDLSIWTQKRNGLLTKIKNHKPSHPPIFELEKQLKSLDKAKPIKPKVPQLLFQDVTPEALSFELHKVWSSGAVISAEAGIVFGSHGMGQDSVMRNLATLNILWDGGELKVSRRTQESYSLIGARLTVSLQVQEPTVRNFIAKSGNLARGTGFLARFLIAQPSSTQGERPYTESPLNWPYLDAFNARMLVILNSPQPQNEAGYLEPTLVLLSKEAKELWVTAHNAIESQLKGELFEIRDVASKAADNIARIACLFHKFSGESGPISAVHLEAATRIGIWHLDQSRRFLSKLERSPKEVSGDRLFDWLLTECKKSETGSVTQRHAQQFGPIRDRKALSETIKYLCAQQLIEVFKEGKSTLIKPKPIQSEQDE